jgi:hypothetical protein
MRVAGTSTDEVYSPIIDREITNLQAAAKITIQARFARIEARCGRRVPVYNWEIFKHTVR